MMDEGRHSHGLRTPSESLDGYNQSLLEAQPTSDSEIYTEETAVKVYPSPSKRDELRAAL